MNARLLVLALLLPGCRPAASPALPAGLRWIQGSADPLQWQRAGFIEVVTPVRPPTSADGASRISVQLRVPDAGLAMALEPDGMLTAVLPPGSVAVRAELDAAVGASRDAAVGERWRVLDVRQFEWTPQGLACSVLRPAADGTLEGIAWACGAAEDARAGEALADLVVQGRLRGPASTDLRRAAGARLAKINACSTCHAPGSPEDRRPSALVQRAVDLQGLFSLRAVFSDESPSERYRPVDPNREDPLMRRVCPDSALDPGQPLCRDGQRPRLRLDVRAGVAARDAHVLQVCQSRRHLASRLTAEGRQASAAFLEECD